VVLENMEDQLINDPELNLETVHEPNVIRGGADRRPLRTEHQASCRQPR
jgi:hypothetical protein